MRKDFERAYLTEHEHVAVLAMNHPEVMNAASIEMIRGLYAALDEVEKPDSSFRALVITGEGRGFCSGANLSEVPEEGASPGAVGSALDSAYHPFLRRLRQHVRRNVDTGRLQSVLRIELDEPSRSQGNVENRSAFRNFTQKRVDRIVLA